MIMKIYMFIEDIPELRHLPKDDAFKLYTKFWLKAFCHWGQWLGITSFSLCLLCWFYLVVPILKKIGMSQNIFDLATMITLVLFSLAGSIAYQTILLIALRKMMRSSGV